MSTDQMWLRYLTIPNISGCFYIYAISSFDLPNCTLGNSGPSMQTVWRHILGNQILCRSDLQL